MMIHDVKDDYLFQVPGKEPSMSSKYGHQGQGVLGTLPIMLRELKFVTQVKNDISL